MQRIEMDKVNEMIEASKESLQESAPAITGPLADDPISPEIEFDDFAKIDLRVAKIVKAEHVEKADKLLRLELDQLAEGVAAVMAEEHGLGLA